MRKALPILLAGLLLAACTSTDSILDPDITVGSPGYPVLIVAYTPNVAVRTGFEDQLEADLAAKGLESVASHDLVESFDLVREPLLMTLADDRDAPLVLMVRRVITELPGDGTTPPEGITRHRTLREYFLAVDRTRLPDLPPPGRQVIEVAGYLRREDRTELVWSGYTWVDFDGDLNAAIRETADTVARNLAPACQGISCDF